jgi:RND family efflux transporter MFP subunit
MKKLLLMLLPLSLAATAARAAPAADGGHACLIEPFQKVDLRSAVEARIDTIHVNRGAEVRKGQVLVELDTAAERIALEGARYRAVMEGQVRSAQSKLEAAREKFRRREELVQEKFIAAQDRDDSRAEMQMAEAGLVEARDNRRLAEIEQRRLAEAVEQRRIRSPLNGIVIERVQQVGEIAQGGESARPILRLAQTHPLRVEVVLPVSMYGKVRSGAKATVQAEAPLSGRYEASVTVVDRVVDSASGTFGVRLELPNPSGEIPAGIKCRIQFPQGAPSSSTL